MTSLLYIALALATEPILTPADAGRDHMMFTVDDTLIEVSSEFLQSRKEYVWRCRAVSSEGEVGELSVPFHNTGAPNFAFASQGAVWVGPAIQPDSKTVGLVRCGADGRHDVEHWRPAGKRDLLSGSAGRQGFWLNTVQGTKLRPVLASLGGDIPDLGTGAAFPVDDGGRLEIEHAVVAPGFGGSVLARYDNGRLVTVAGLDGKTTAAWPLGENQWLTAKHMGDRYAMQIGVSENGSFKPQRELETVETEKGWSMPVAVHPLGDHWLVVMVDQHTESGADSAVQALTSPPTPGGTEARPVANNWRVQQAVRLVVLNPALETVSNQAMSASISVPSIHEAPVWTEDLGNGRIRVQWVNTERVYWTDVVANREIKLKSQGFDEAIVGLINGSRLGRAGSPTPGRIVWWGPDRLLVSTGTKGDWAVHQVTIGRR